MPKKNYKGQSRHFTSAEELEQARIADLGGEGGPAALPVPKKVDPEDDPEEGEEEEEEEEEEDEDGQKHKGIGHLIEVSNPNRVAQKPKKASEVGQIEMGKKTKEQLEADRLRQQAERKQVEADLARLAIIRKQREEEERKLAEAKKLKELKGAHSSTSPSAKQ